MSKSQSADKKLELGDPIGAVEFYFSQGWTDGLPVVPPTVEKVQEFLTFAGRAPTAVIGTEPFKGHRVTAEKVAVNAVMAGCRPEYFPVVLAAVEAVTDPLFNLNAISIATDGATVFTVVNGPVARDIGMNSGVNLFGPGNRANATIGRAVQLVISNATGATASRLVKATIGHPGMFTWCVTEAEHHSPWEPLHVQNGFERNESAVTVFAALAPIQVRDHVDRRPEDILRGFGAGMLAASYGIYGAVTAERGVVLVMSPELSAHFESAGWSKRKVQEVLFDITRQNVTDWIRKENEQGRDASEISEPVSGIVKGPETIAIIVAGGAAGAFASIIPVVEAQCEGKLVTKPVTRPPK